MQAENTAALHAALKQHFGFAAFRPLQEQIIRDVLAGRDVLTILPTGGGKSLCFQLPALLRPGLTVVVSPLIALMKDQVDALLAAGVPAAFLNSSLDALDRNVRLVDLDAGRYRLLYAAPERIVMPDFLAKLKRWNVTLFAIDEAHCISEWGHDFRPEYRQLEQLRDRFPNVPIMALTATATDRVREDIIARLKLRDPGRYVGSFNRPNLIYRVIEKNDPERQLFSFLSKHPGESGIVYCQARKRTEAVAEFLNQNGIAARPYHAGLTAEQRGEHQDLFLRDDVRVICATIAFGMGINKPNVRFVVHYDLPKNIEGYYQETGRAGRDGLPSECLLLFSRGDIAKQMHFIEEMTDEHERETTRRQLWTLVRYAEAHGCRRVPLLGYFGETYAESSCGACDHCLGDARESYDGTLVAQKYLSCLYRIRQSSAKFGCGANYIVDLLRGKENEVMAKWGHTALSTFGIGKDLSAKAWQAVGREMIRLGFAREVAEGQYMRIELTETGKAALVARQPITLTRAPGAQDAEPQARFHRPRSDKPVAPRPPANTEYDEELFQRLRALRRKLADERRVSSFVIFPDSSLRQMARDCPTNEVEFAQISGVGEKKLKEFAALFLAEINGFSPPRHQGTK